MTKVLFICQANVGRSQMAEGFYNALSHSQNAASVGLVDLREKYQGHPAPEVTAAMREEGVDISRQQITLLKEETLSQFEKIIILCDKALCPQYLINNPSVTFSPIEDPYQKGMSTVREVRDQIKAIVIDLLRKDEE